MSTHAESANRQSDSSNSCGEARALPPRSVFAPLWPLDPQTVFLNHGSFGSCPNWVLEQQREIAARLEREPIRFIVEEAEGMWDRARRALAEFVRADSEGLAFVTNATEGVNTVVRSLKFEPGDELLTNTHEYNACNNALRFAAARDGAKVVVAEVPFPIRTSAQVVEAVLGAVTPRTRLVLLSHVTSPSGLIFPVAEIVAELNRRGIESLVDGAHAPGMFAMDIGAINPTYYTGNCHKWLCAPKGVGFLWVREERRKTIRPLVISHGANSTRADRSLFRLEFDYTGTRDFSAAICLPLVISYLASLQAKGWSGIYASNRDLALRGRRLLAAKMGTELPAPEEMIGTLGSVLIASRPAGVTPPVTKYHDALQDELIRRWRVQVPVFTFSPRADAKGGVRVARIACQLYNSFEQVEYLAEALRAELKRESCGK